MDDEAVEKLVEKLNDIVSDEDSIRLYALCATCESAIRVLGSGKITQDENVYIL
jgi:CRISPR-associated protein Cas2